MNHYQKTYNNIFYLRNNQITIKDNNKYYEITLSNKSLSQGYILNKDYFLKELSYYLKINHLNKFLWHKRILIITDFLYSFNEKRILKDTFKELGYREITIKSIENILKVTKEDYFLINGNSLRLIYVDNLNTKGNLELNLNILSTSEIMLLLKNRCQNKRLFILNEDENLLKVIDKLNINYYYYEKKYHFF